MHTFPKNKNAFTLLEMMFAIVLLGVAIAALMVSNKALTKANGAGLEMATAEFLIEQIRELTAQLPVCDPQTGKTNFGAEEGGIADYDDLDDFNAREYSPPIDAGRNTLSDYTGYCQQVTVDNVSAADLTTTVGDHTSDFYRMTVKVLLNGREISSASWIRANL